MRRDSVKAVRALLIEDPHRIYLHYGNYHQNLLQYLTKDYVHMWKVHATSLREMIQVVLEAAARIDDQPTATALHHICRHGNDSDIPLLRLMLEQPKLSGSCRSKNLDGETPVFLAVVNNKSGLLGVLLEYDVCFYRVEWRPERIGFYLKSDIKGRLLTTDTLCMLIKNNCVHLDMDILVKAIAIGNSLVVQAILDTHKVSIDDGDFFNDLCKDLLRYHYTHSLFCIDCVELILSQRELYVYPPHQYEVGIVKGEWLNIAALLVQEQLIRHSRWTRQFLTKQSRPWILEEARAVVITLQYRIKLPNEIVFMILSHVKCCN